MFWGCCDWGSYICIAHAGIFLASATTIMLGRVPVDELLVILYYVR